jgi:hypothetical protein
MKTTSHSCICSGWVDESKSKQVVHIFEVRGDNPYRHKSSDRISAYLTGGFFSAFEMCLHSKVDAVRGNINVRYL